MIDIGHPLNIGTLAVWLSVSGFGAVGLVVRMPEPAFPKSNPEVEIRIKDDDFILGDSPSAPVSAVMEPQPMSVPQPPELPQLAEIEPLPEIPDLPAEAPQAADPKPAGAPAAGNNSPSPRSSGAGTRRGTTSSSQGGGRSGGTSSGMSNSDRVAAGRMQSPGYPPYSRRNNQQGVVIVEFTVDASGKVISAYAKKPSPWPLLNNEAVSTVRLWRFPPGGVMTLQRPIVFRLH